MSEMFFREAPAGRMPQEEKSTAGMARRLMKLLAEDSGRGESQDRDFQEELERLKILMSYYQCALLTVETKFRVLSEQFSLNYDRNPIEMIKTRLKSPESIRDKIVRRNWALGLETIENTLSDVAGIRVVCSFIDDIYRVEECLLRQDDVRLIAKKDYIKNPKESGYRSLHLLIEVPIFLQNEKKEMKVEVQLRTIAMELWANLEHKLRYKKDISEEAAMVTTEELFECAEMSALLDLKMQRVHDIIESNRIEA